MLVAAGVTAAGVTAAWPAVGAAWERVGSPRGLSIFTTSAPRSASSMPLTAPAIQIVMSTTRMPASGPERGSGNVPSDNVTSSAPRL